MLTATKDQAVPDPVLEGATAWARLAGHSEAFVWLASFDGRRWVVRKVAKRPEGSERLRRQASKQRRFASLGEVSGLRVPPVLSEGEIEGRYFFDMEYVAGADGASFLRRAGFDEVRRFADALSAHMEAAACSEPISEVADSAFDALYARVCRAWRSSGGIVDKETLAGLLLAMDGLRRAEPISPTACHGDLTLENIVVDAAGRMWVIDLLDGPLEHWWQDLAKIHQDLLAGWYELSGPKIARSVRDYVSRRLLDTAAKLDSRYLELHELLVAVTLMRVLPYAKDEQERRFLAQRVTALVEGLEAGRSRTGVEFGR